RSNCIWPSPGAMPPAVKRYLRINTACSMKPPRQTDWNLMPICDKSLLNCPRRIRLRLSRHCCRATEIRAGLVEQERCLLTAYLLFADYCPHQSVVRDADQIVSRLLLCWPENATRYRFQVG